MQAVARVEALLCYAFCMCVTVVSVEGVVLSVADLKVLLEETPLYTEASSDKFGKERPQSLNNVEMVRFLF